MKQARGGRSPGASEDREGSVRAIPGAKRLLFALLPTGIVLLLVAGIEAWLRLAGLEGPGLRPAPVPAELAGIHRADDELLWTMRPGFDGEFQGVRIVTNTLGLRSPEVGDKLPGELRILSLGESTTFGAMVLGDRTYSARLEARLDGTGGARIRVINAGVSAWTSFQSLKYLELRGIALAPDVVLFYHEHNEHLPSSVRDFGGGERSLALSDRQLFASRSRTLHRALASRSAIYRWLANRAAYERVEAMQDAGGPGLSIQKGVVESSDGRRELLLPERVPPEDRKRNLAELLALCRRHGIRLVAIHPTYRYSGRHTCILTEFCAANGVPMFEAFDSLHPGGAGDRTLFLDNVHPTEEGHDRLARGLARFLVEHRLVTGPGP